MVGRVLELESILRPDSKAVKISSQYIQYELLRQTKKNDWDEIKRYVYATDTTQTSNAALPWKNKTTVPKLCQIMDNLYANYLTTLFPQRKSVIWEANEQDSASQEKRDAITNYIQWVMTQTLFKVEMEKIILDYIQYGNCFATVEWIDQRVNTKDLISTTAMTQVGYVGPMIKRVNPLDIVFNPTAESFVYTPKIVRSLVSLGELKELLERMSNDENRAEYEELYKYLKEIRTTSRQFEGDFTQRDGIYAMDGFTSFRSYLTSDVVEVLTFYGDLYDAEDDKLYKNHVITVVDRHKLIGCKPNPSFFGYPPIFHCPWRRKQDNLWGMGPLDNLVGMQFRMDHVENMGSDIWDFVVFPVQQINGFVEDYVWGPGAKIYASEEGNVEIKAPDVNIMQSDMKVERLERLMEEMAGAPREAMGFRTPGEKTKYEVQSLENASARLYQNKIYQFSEMLELLLNGCLELARRNMTGATTIKVFDNEFNAASFQALTVEDITGIGRIKPVAARHFAEQAQLIQNLTNLTGSGMWQTVQPHFSGIKLAQLLSKVFNLEDYDIVLKNVAISEQAEAAKFAQALQEQVHMAGTTATGIGEDHDLSAMQQQMSQQQAQQGLQAQ